MNAMGEYEFRLLDASGKLSKTEKRLCDTVAMAVEVGVKLVSGHKWVEIWAGSQAIARIPHVSL